MDTSIFTNEQITELNRMKAYFPYRIIFGYFDKDSGVFTASASQNMRLINKIVKEGHKTYIYCNDFLFK